MEHPIRPNNPCIKNIPCRTSECKKTCEKWKEYEKRQAEFRNYVNKERERLYG